MRGFVLALGILGLLLFAWDPAISQSASAEARAPQEPVKFPSMVELLARPGEYEGALIEVKGFYGGIFYTLLFLTRDHAEIDDTDSAFLVIDETEGFISKHCAGYYVTIEGRFKRRLERPGPDPENFEIDDLTQVSVIKDGKETTCWPPETEKRR